MLDEILDFPPNCKLESTKKNFKYIQYYNIKLNDQIKNVY